MGSECNGKIWVVCTGQEAIDEIIKTRQDQFSRIQARFKTRLSLTSSSADEVIQKRILRKKDEVTPQLEQVYDENDSVLRNLFSFNYSAGDAVLDIKGFNGPGEFARDFPFVPYQFHHHAEGICRDPQAWQFRKASVRWGAFHAVRIPGSGTEDRG